MKKIIVGFIGCGHMSSHLISGIVSNEQYSPEQIWVSDINQANLSKISAETGVRVSTDNKAVAEKADILVLGVLPHALETVCEEIAEITQKKNSLIISIAAGVNCDILETWLGKSTSIVRAMPNIPVKVKEGVLALFANSQIEEDQKKSVEVLFNTIGLTCWMSSESQLDTVTVLSGCGPAYFLLVMESLQKAAEALGIDKEIAKELTIQTALGTAKMASQSDEPLDIQRKHVCPPGGVTEQAIFSFIEDGIDEMFKKALLRARKKVTEVADIKTSK